MNELSLERKMTVKEVAEVLQVSDKHIRETIKKLFPNILQNGKVTFLNEQQVTAIKLKIDKNPYLNQSVEVKTELEKELLIQQAMMFQAEKIQSMQTLLDAQKPAVDFYKAVTDSRDAIEMSKVAKMLDMGIGRNKLFEILREKQILRQNNEPYQTFIDRGYFRVIEQKYTPSPGETRISIKTLVYQKGLDYIRKVLVKEVRS